MRCNGQRMEQKMELSKDDHARLTHAGRTQYKMWQIPTKKLDKMIDKQNEYPALIEMWRLHTVVATGPVRAASWAWLSTRLPDR